MSEIFQNKKSKYYLFNSLNTSLQTFFKSYHLKKKIPKGSLTPNLSNTAHKHLLCVRHYAYHTLYLILAILWGTISILILQLKNLNSRKVKYIPMVTHVRAAEQGMESKLSTLKSSSLTTITQPDPASPLLFDLNLLVNLWEFRCQWQYLTLNQNYDLNKIPRWECLFISNSLKFLLN